MRTWARTLLLRAVTTGGHADDTARKYRTVVITNIVLLALIVISLASIPAGLLWAKSLPIVVNAASFAALFLFCLVANYARFHDAVRMALTVFACVDYVGVCLMLGPAAGADVYALAFVVVPFLIFTRDERVLMWLAYAVIAVSVVAVQVGFRYVLPIVAMDPGDIPNSRLFCLIGAGAIVTGASIYYHLAVAAAERRLEGEILRSEDLLSNILPVPISDRLKRRENPIADECNDVTVLFADIVGFTSFAMRRSPEKVVSVLNEVFYRFDELTEQLGLEKIKTIGDAYMVACGLPKPRADHAQAIADMGLGMLAAMEDLKRETGSDVTLRIGIHSGRVVAGVIGKNKYSYDLWGDTVNIASRIESTGEQSRVHLSETTYELLKQDFDFTDRRTVELKGRGAMNSYFLVGRKSNVADHAA